MASIDQNFLKLPGSYLFSEVARHIAAREARRPGERVLRLSIGDVTQPLPQAVVEEMVRAAEEMGTPEGFRGYGPEQGYLFLRQAIAQQDYAQRGIQIDPGEIFISDGAKTDCAAVGELFSRESAVALCDPVYPVYADASAMAGRAGEWEKGRWSKLCYLSCGKENGFIPDPPEEGGDLVYLCFPNNPTGAVASRQQLQRWVNWANSRGAVIVFDAAYEAFVQSPDIPRSIYELRGADRCAIEIRSFSKTAGFTGVRCGCTVVPGALVRQGASLRDLWLRRQATKHNGVSYVVQRGAAAVYTPRGQAQVGEQIAYYRENAQIIREGLQGAGIVCHGGVDAPYIWLEVPGGMGSWAFFHRLLEEAAVAVAPGAGFGPGGEGYVRLSAFGTRQDTVEAVERICALVGRG